MYNYFKSDILRCMTSISGISRLAKLPGHLVGPVTQEFEIPILLPPNPIKNQVFDP